eukprot:3052271-Rhodomonas_salina.1
MKGSAGFVPQALALALRNEAHTAEEPVGGHDAADILGEALDEMEPVEHNHDTFDPEIEGHEEHGEAQVVMLFLFSALLVGCASRFMLEVAPSAHLSAPVCSRSYGGAIAMTFPLTRRCAPVSYTHLRAHETEADL